VFASQLTPPPQTGFVIEPVRVEYQGALELEVWSPTRAAFKATARVTKWRAPEPWIRVLPRTRLQETALPIRTSHLRHRDRQGGRKRRAGHSAAPGDSQILGQSQAPPSCDHHQRAGGSTRARIQTDDRVQCELDKGAGAGSLGQVGACSTLPSVAGCRRGGHVGFVPSAVPSPNARRWLVPEKPRSRAKIQPLAVVPRSVSKTVSGEIPPTRVRIPPPPFCCVSGDPGHVSREIVRRIAARMSARSRPPSNRSPVGRRRGG
jgi:hypothetical protein